MLLFIYFGLFHILWLCCINCYWWCFFQWLICLLYIGFVFVGNLSTLWSLFHIPYFSNPFIESYNSFKQFLEISSWNTSFKKRNIWINLHPEPEKRQCERNDTVKIGVVAWWSGPCGELKVNWTQYKPCTPKINIVNIVLKILIDGPSCMDIFPVYICPFSFIDVK